MERLASVSALGYHVMLRLEDDRVILRGAHERRAAARIFLRHGERCGLCAFGCADTHMHSVLRCDERTAGRFVRSVTCSLHRALRLDVPFQVSRRKPLADQHHFYASFRYAHRQERHHGCHVDPFSEASSLPDLLGLRCVPSSIGDRVKTYLPRIHDDELLQLLVCAEEAFAAPMAHDEIAAAAAAAFALEHVQGQEPDAVRARAAAVHAVGSELGNAELARALSIDPRTVQRLRARPVAATEQRAVELQLRLRSALRSQPRPEQQTREESPLPYAP
jgi:REP element-mobilizing transposase RayT